jgi:cytidylate kinase
VSDQADYIVTLDGPAGVGKTTLARALATRLNIPYLDTGAMFRAIAAMLGDQSWTLEKTVLQNHLQEMSFSLSGDQAESELLLNNRPLDPEIRSEEVGIWASNLATLPVVRSFLKREQQGMAQRHPLVCEGRDMGSVVFPQARFKFFLEATPEERARRRWLQLKDKGTDVDLDTLTRDLAQRDTQDRNRTIAPLQAAPDAHVIDTTRLTEDQVVTTILEIIDHD